MWLKSQSMILPFCVANRFLLILYIKSSFFNLHVLF